MSSWQLSQLLFNHIQSYLVPATIKIRIKEAINNLQGKAPSDHTLSHNKNIGIVVHARHSSQVQIVAKCRPYTLVAVRNNTHANA